MSRPGPRRGQGEKLHRLVITGCEKCGKERMKGKKSPGKEKDESDSEGRGAENPAEKVKKKQELTAGNGNIHKEMEGYPA